MGGFAIFAGIVLALVLLGRYLRAREQEAFRGEDVKALKDFAPSKPKPGTEPGPIVDVEALTIKYPDLVLPTAPEVAVPEYRLREPVLDEIHLNVLAILERLLPKGYGIFVQMPLMSFVRVEGGDAGLYGRSVSFLVCKKPDYRVAFAITLRGAGATEVEQHQLLTTVFEKLEIPLLTLPMVSGISAKEVSEQIDKLDLA